jgi:hypothetical protein
MIGSEAICWAEHSKTAPSAASFGWWAHGSRQHQNLAVLMRLSCRGIWESTPLALLQSSALNFKFLCELWPITGMLLTVSRRCSPSRCASQDSLGLSGVGVPLQCVCAAPSGTFDGRLRGCQSDASASCRERIRTARSARMVDLGAVGSLHSLEALPSVCASSSTPRSGAVSAADISLDAGGDAMQCCDRRRRLSALEGLHVSTMIRVALLASDWIDRHPIVHCSMRRSF